MQQSPDFTTNSKFGSKQTITKAVNYLTMAGKHSAEICKLVGLYILNGIKSKLNGIKVGIYTDDWHIQQLIKIQLDGYHKN